MPYTTWIVLCLASFTLGYILTNKIDRGARSSRSSSSISSSSRGSIISGLVHPIVLVPGNGGSQLEVRLNKTKSSHWWCSKTSNWYTLWLNLEQLGPWQISCFAENIRLIYDPITHTTSNAPGVETRIQGFGNTSTVEFISSGQWGFSEYFSAIVDAVLPQGYIRGQNIHGAPYDFRKAANEHGAYFRAVQSLVERSFLSNGNTSVILICHSMGCPMTHFFLRQLSQTWRDQYVRAVISLAGAWGGTAKALKVLSMGDNMDIWLIDSAKLREEQISNPSLAWLMPQEEFWGEDEVLVETEHRNFTRSQLADFALAAGEPNFASMMRDTGNLTAGLTAPGVEVFCIYVSQVARLIFPTGLFPPLDLSKKPQLVKGDGDGTVNIHSLEGCLRWKNQQKQKVTHQVFPGVSHSDILKQAAPTSYVASVVAELNSGLRRAG